MTVLRQISLLVTSGGGPAECQQAVAGVLDVMRREAECFAVDFDVNGARTKHGFKSAAVLIGGADAEVFAQKWRGTIQWRASSKLRPTHKRANWFIGVFDLPAPAQTPQHIHPRDVTFDTFRAGGPGGQHQNTTDSAVRATHTPTGLSAVAREERSQHRNKSLALGRLQHLMAAQIAADEEAQKARRNVLHHALERGNPVRCFTGHDFREVKGG
ncbi:peptide chain release factor [Aliiroseovarius halocynthiae]|uniref:Peptide chain release factor H n=1 Tax=Aliiroseovarius halocynthiae TaxID=985055 RepID=A0A545SUT4_9RHOB|nr:peptide chain release factor H [Aliiroseovarius halocynthiae]TQV68732.1 peptide chain release factor H [Aliiroseovarius halocynthiae]SMR71154.1 peptide chain release factor [Aliiroseovarius halocynthiae]